MSEKLESIIEQESPVRKKGLWKRIKKGIQYTAAGVGVWGLSVLPANLDYLIRQAQAKQLTLGWDRPTGTIKGYTIYHGPSSRNYPNTIRIPIGDLTDPDHPKYTVHDLDDTGRVYLAVTAYNDAGESGFSNEVCDPPLDGSSSPPSQDNEAPQIFLNQSTDYVSGPYLQISGHVTDNASVASLDVKINGEDYTGSLSIHGTINDKTFDTGLINIGEGENTVIITATDSDGNASVYGYTQINIINPPVIDTESGLSAEFSDNGFDLGVQVNGYGITSVRMNTAEAGTLDMHLDDGKWRVNDPAQLKELLTEYGTLHASIIANNGTDNETIKQGSISYQSTIGIPFDDMENLADRVDYLRVEDFNDGIDNWGRSSNYDDIFTLIDDDGKLRVDYNNGVDSGRYFFFLLHNDDYSDYGYFSIDAKALKDTHMEFRVRDENGASARQPFMVGKDWKNYAFDIRDLSKTQVNRILWNMYDTEGDTNSLWYDNAQFFNLSPGLLKWNRSSNYPHISLSQDFKEKIEGSSSLRVDYQNNVDSGRFFFGLADNADWSDVEYLTVAAKALKETNMEFRVRDENGASARQPFIVGKDWGYHAFYIGGLSMEQVNRTLWNIYDTEGDTNVIWLDNTRIIRAEDLSGTPYFSQDDGSVVMTNWSD